MFLFVRKNILYLHGAFWKCLISIREKGIKYFCIKIFYNNIMNNYIFTCNSKNSKLTVYEFERNDNSFKFIKWIDEGVGLFQTELNNEALCEYIRQEPIIFVRHIFRIDGISNLNEFVNVIVSYCKNNMKKYSSFTVQTRCSKKTYISIKNMSTRMAGILSNEQYTLDVASGKYIISIFIDGETVFWGIGNEKYNLSHWKGGMPHYSPTSKYKFVSRAEYKLIEAIECFGIDIKNMEKGADLGAAPGGWTKVLVDNGVECTSIDPSFLKPEIAKNSKVKYFHMLVEDYLNLKNDDEFDIIVNDMKIDVKKSVNIINQFYDKIKKEGIVIVTFKLTHEYNYSFIRKWIESFNGFTLIGARQLFHNRTEITVVMKKNNKLRNNNTNNSNNTNDSQKNNRNKKMSKKLQRKINKQRK